MKKWLIPAGLTLVVGGLAWHFYNQAKRIMDYCFTFDGYKILSLGAKNIKLQLNLAVKNNSDVDLNINGYDLNISLNNKSVGKVSSDKKQLLQANSKSVLELVVSFNPVDTIKNAINFDFLKGVVLDPSKVLVNVKGTVNIGQGVIKVNNIPVDFNLTLKDMLPDNSGQQKPCL